MLRWEYERGMLAMHCSPFVSGALCPPVAAPAQLSEHGGGRRGSGGSKGHIPDRRIHTLFKDSAAGSEKAGGWCIKPPKANYSSFFSLFLFVM